MNKNAAKSKKANKPARKSASNTGIDVEAAHRNIAILKRRRVRIQKCVDNLTASLEGTTEIDADDITEAIVLLGLYKRRLGRAKARREAALAGDDTVEED